jgi:hypothetical protein
MSVVTSDEHDIYLFNFSLERFALKMRYSHPVNLYITMNFIRLLLRHAQFIRPTSHIIILHLSFCLDCFFILSIFLRYPLAELTQTSFLVVIAIFFGVHRRRKIDMDGGEFVNCSMYSN